MLRLLRTAVAVLATLVPLSCTDTEADRTKTAGKVIAKERAALKRWSNGDPTSYLEAFGPEITNFNPFLDHRVDGLAAMSDCYQSLAGQISIDRFEIVEPHVQIHDDVAILSYHLYTCQSHPDGSGEETTRWNSTKVYTWNDGDWRIVHNRWAYLKPDVPQNHMPREKAIDKLVQEFFDSSAFPSLSVGLVENDALVYAGSFGVADRASGQRATARTIYEIGSVGKVFTATVLAILHDRGVLRIDDPVEKWLPAIVDITNYAENSPRMTLEHLATHTSGLPGIPANVGHLPPFQWKGYSAEDLHQSFRKTELLHPAGEDLVYSTLGMGILGHVMAVATQRSYEELIAEELLLPLGMRDTVISLQPHQEKRYSVGYPSDDSTGEVPYFEYGILSGGGAHRSTVADLALFLQAQWESPGITTNPLNERARAELHRTRWKSGEDDGTGIALGWFTKHHEGIGTIFAHRGRTPGHGAVVQFIPEQRAGVILLANQGGRDANIRMADFAGGLLLDFVTRQVSPDSDSSESAIGRNERTLQ